MNPILNSLRRLTAAALLVASVSSAMATDFYVSSVHANRNDANPGTSPTAPWATFDKIKTSWGTTIRPGDTVHLERGSVWTWSGQLYWRIDVGGNAVNGPMTIRGDDYGTGAKPVLRKNGNTTLAGAGVFYLANGSYVTMRDFVVDGGSQAGFFACGIEVGGYGQSANISNIRLLNMTYQNLGNNPGAYIFGIRFSAFNNYTITDCLVEGCDISGYSSHGINHYSQKITSPTASLIHRNVYRNNRVHDPSVNIWQGSVSSGIHVSFGGSGNIFEYNYVEGRHPLGQFFLMNCANSESGLIIRNNVLRNNPGGSGILLSFDSGGSAGATLTASIYNNVIANCMNAGIAIDPNGYYTGTLDIHHNTLYDNEQRPGIYSGEMFIGPQPINVNAYNNIFVHLNHAGSPAICLVVYNGYSGAFTHRNNLYWNIAGSSQNAINDRGTYYTVANAKNYEATAQNTDPLFTDITQPPSSITSAAGPSPNGFMPRSGSPAIDRASALGAAYATALNLVTRPQGTGWDIGAYEFSTSGPTPTPVPAAPSNLRTQASGTNQITLTWTDNAVNETGFKVERSTGNATFTQIGTTGSNVATYVDRAISLGVTNAYRVRATSAGGDSAYSEVASAIAGELVLDNADPSCTQTFTQDAWQLYQQADGQHYGGSHSFNHTAGTGGDVMRWTFTLPAPGTYDVYAWWWEGANRPGDVPFTIGAPGATGSTVRVDQRTNGGQWNLLGSFPFGTQGVVSVSDAVASGSDVVGDAIRLVFRSASTPGTPTPPAAPSDLAVTASSTSSVTLAWTDNAVNETGFRIERSGDGTTFASAGTAPSNATTFTHTGLTLLSTNYYRVKATSGAGDSAYSAVVQAIPGELVFDNRDTGVSVIGVQDAWNLYQDPAGQHYAGSHLYNNAAGTGQDRVTWTFPVQARGTYDVYAWWWEGSHRPTNVPYLVTHAAGVATNRVDQRTNGGRWNLLGSYSFSGTGSVAVTDGFTSGVDANADAIRLVFRTASVPAIEPPPTAPSNLTATAVSPTQVTLTWQDVTNETGFAVERGTNASVFVPIATLPTNRTTHSDTGLVMNVTYYYRVRAFNASGDSPYGNTASVTMPAPQQPPLAPASLTASAVSTSLVNLAWQDRSTDEAGFRLERGTNGTAFAALATVPTNRTTYSDTSVKMSATYYYRVKAFNASGESAYANVASATTPGAQLPAAPTGLSAVMVASNQVLLSWRDNATGETGFRIERGTNGVAFAQLATAGADATNYTDAAITPGAIYYYRVQAYSSAGASPWSSVASLTPGEIIIDNLDAGFTSVSGQDPWVLYQDPAGQHYRGSHFYNHATGTGLDSATWAFTVPLPGIYEVFAWWWDGAWRPSDATVVVTHYGRSTALKMDQRTNGGGWVSLGVFPFTDEGAVTVTDEASGGGDVVADAIRVMFRPDIPFVIPAAPMDVRPVSQ